MDAEFIECRKNREAECRILPLLLRDVLKSVDLGFYSRNDF